MYTKGPCPGSPDFRIDLAVLKPYHQLIFISPFDYHHLRYHHLAPCRACYPRSSPFKVIAWITPSLYCAYCLYSKQFYLKDFYFLPFGYFSPVLVFWAVGHDKNLFELFLAILGYSLFDLAWNMDCSKRHSSNWEMSLNFLDRLAGFLMFLFRTLSESAQKWFTNGFWYDRDSYHRVQSKNWGDLETFWLKYLWMKSFDTQVME